MKHDVAVVFILNRSLSNDCGSWNTSEEIPRRGRHHDFYQPVSMDEANDLFGYGKDFEGGDEDGI